MQAQLVKSNEELFELFSYDWADVQTKNYYTQLFEKYYVLAILMPDTNTSPVNSEKPYYVGVELNGGDLYIEILKECYAESEIGRQDMLLIAVTKEKNKRQHPCSCL